MEAELHYICHSTIGWVVRLKLLPLYSGYGVPGTHQTGGWVGLIVGMGARVTRKLLPWTRTEPRLSRAQPSRHTDWTFPTALSNVRTLSTVSKSTEKQKTDSFNAWWIIWRKREESAVVNFRMLSRWDWRTEWEESETARLFQCSSVHH
jgi:hypothetical protein